MQAVNVGIEGQGMRLLHQVEPVPLRHELVDLARLQADQREGLAVLHHGVGHASGREQAADDVELAALGELAGLGETGDANAAKKIESGLSGLGIRGDVVKGLKKS